MTDSIVERLAALEHARWSRWMQWMLDNWTDENIARWKQQMVTDYADLPEHSKESDRKEARAALTVALDHLQKPSKVALATARDRPDVNFFSDTVPLSIWRGILSQLRKEALK